jgi:hypothetical protein
MEGLLRCAGGRSDLAEGESRKVSAWRLRFRAGSLGGDFCYVLADYELAQRHPGSADSKDRDRSDSWCGSQSGRFALSLKDDSDERRCRARVGKRRDQGLDLSPDRRRGLGA